MTAEEAFNKYAHMDSAFSDYSIMPGSFWGSVIIDLWSAVKNSLKEKGSESD